MKRDNRIRWILVLALIIVSGWYLYPTFQYYSLDETAKSDPARTAEIQDLELKAIKRGLDLQGGIRMEMEIDLSSLVSNLASNKDDLFETFTADAEASLQSGSQDYIGSFLAAAESKNIKLERYYERDRRLDENNEVRAVADYLRIQADEGIQQSLNILRNRIDQFGVAEPNIYKQGDRRIVIELPGLDNIEVAKDLIGQTANLEFRLEKPAAVFSTTLTEIDRVLKANESDTPVAEVDSTAKVEPSTSTEVDISDLFEDTPAEETADKAVVDLNTFGDRPFQSMLVNFNGLVAADERNIPAINALLERPDVKSVIPSDGEFLWAAEPFIDNEVNYFQLFLLKKDAELGGDVVVDARVQIGSGYDPSTAGKPTISMEMNREGGRKWSRVTGANIQKRIAIILDGKILSAPVVNSKIPDGKSTITGMAGMNEAKNLAINLRTGSFKADMNIIAEQAVGPSLGADSIRKGTYSAIAGLIMVVVFMLIYYKGSGSVATLALSLNLIFIMAILAGFHATLTLPGIAGLILTIGMAVDANVLIFERIREELRTGKTVRASIDSGYSRAFFTILDANITTLITAVILYQYGTGPIKGFALTLSIGIMTSMFTAIVVTRLVYDFVTSTREVSELSI